MADRPFSRRNMLFPAVAAVALSAFALAALASGSESRVSADTLSLIYVNCSGLKTNPSPVPAGSYNVLVYNDDSCRPANFQLTGPGVNLTTDEDSTGMGIDHPAGPFGPYTFQAGSTYTARDSSSPGVSVTFTVTAASTSSGGSGSGGSGSSGGGGTTTTSGGTGTGSGSGSTGTKTVTTVGTISAAVSVTGKASLKFAGTAVKSLKAGRYKLTVADKSKKANLIIQKLGYHAMTYSTRAAVGTTSHTLTLDAGKWFFRASATGPKTYFIVK